MKLYQTAIAVLLILALAVESFAKDAQKISLELESPSLLTLQTVLNRVEESHPLLKKSQTEKMLASGKLLKALGAFEPTLVNDWELERLAKQSSNETIGFNDTYVEMKHKSGVKVFAGFRAGIGDVKVADLGINDSNQPLLGIAIPLLRGLNINPEHAELKKSHLADKQANLEIQQTRQDLYFGAASQYWNWVAAWKFLEIQEKAVEVAERRLKQLLKQGAAGSIPRFDVDEGRQEVQRRRDGFIKARRKVDEEKLKLELFLWDENPSNATGDYKAPLFPSDKKTYSLNELEKGKQRAAGSRPELKMVSLKAELNQIDLKLAENNLLPDLTLEAEPTRKPGEFVLGLGYRFGVRVSFPFFQRKANGDLLRKKGKAQQLKLLQLYNLKKVALDVENAHSAMTRARERIDVSREALQLAKKLEKGERTRFKHGATTLLVVNMRERNVLSAAKEWITALADYQKAKALFQWSTGEWAEGIATSDEKDQKAKDS